ncbi:nuclear transport factor 2 family protein [Dactylosporangium sp. NPDC051485]|uniref:nuclear transport factor 2 family protein n=1 Tax=Dactylosporangium sp. NPDC051485 TaxID=3154846 RepID=UPI003414A909
MELERVRQVRARYCRYADQQDWAAFRALFADDCQFGSTSMRDVRSPDDFVGRIKALLDGGRSAHYCHTSEIEFTGPGTASAVWSAENVIQVKQGDPFVQRGYCYETYRRDERGHWLITSTKLEQVGPNLIT